MGNGKTGKEDEIVIVSIKMTGTGSHIVAREAGGRAHGQPIDPCRGAVEAARRLRHRVRGVSGSYLIDRLIETMESIE